MTPTGAHWARDKDGTRVWVGPTNHLIICLSEQVRLLELRVKVKRDAIAKARGILMQLKGHDRTVDAAIAALDGL